MYIRNRSKSILTMWGAHTSLNISCTIMSYGFAPFSRMCPLQHVSIIIHLLSSLLEFLASPMFFTILSYHYSSGGLCSNLHHATSQILLTSSRSKADHGPYSGIMWGPYKNKLNHVNNKWLVCNKLTHHIGMYVRFNWIECLERLEDGVSFWHENMDKTMTYPCCNS